MFLLLAAQLTWWLLFFRMTQKETRAIEQALDRERIERLMSGAAPSESDTIACENGACFIKPEVIAAREAQHKRRLSMLISETLFVLSVLSYGSFRVIRSIYTERKLNQERITFLNSVTHELKTPVASVQLMLQTLEKRKLPEAQKQELMSEAVSSLRRLSSQIEDLLLAGEVGRTRRESFRCSASLCTEQAVLRHRATGKKIEAAVEPGLFVPLPESLMGRMLDILTGNALLHGASRRPVEISLKKEGTNAVLRVRDHGEGIPPGEEKAIFRPFHRASKYSGTGLGLYLARQIAQMAGGAQPDLIEARNHPEGGAEFTVRLPALPGEKA